LPLLKMVSCQPPQSLHFPFCVVKMWMGKCNKFLAMDEQSNGHFWANVLVSGQALCLFPLPQALSEDSGALCSGCNLGY
jgi:hypothetical protein